VASANGHEAVARLLIENGAGVKAANENGWTPLLATSVYDHEAVARLLMENGADVKAADKDGQTPLHRAQRMATRLWRDC